MSLLKGACIIDITCVQMHLTYIYHGISIIYFLISYAYYKFTIYTYMYI